MINKLEMIQQNKLCSKMELTEEDIERIDALLEMRSKVKTLKQIGVIKVKTLKNNNTTVNF